METYLPEKDRQKMVRNHISLEVHRVSQYNTQYSIQYRPGQDFHLELGKIGEPGGPYIRPN